MTAYTAARGKGLLQLDRILNAAILVGGNILLMARKVL